MNPGTPETTRSADPVAAGARDDQHCCIVGGGIAGLASAAFLIRDGQVPGRNIRVLEESRVGGSLDASGSAERGYSMRGSRMFGPAYVLTYELLDGIPSLDDPARSIAQDTFEFWQATPWYDRARLVENGRVVDPTDWGLRNRDRADLAKFMLQPEDALGTRRIDECFEPQFFESNFWLMWCSMFGFETWHSAVELRRYLLRFLRLFPDLETMQIIQSTRYNGHDSIVRPLLAWLEQQGVQFETGVQVTDLHFATRDDGAKAVRHISCLRGGVPQEIQLREGEWVIVTLGSMTADSSLGSMNDAPTPKTEPAGGSWALWKRLAEQDRAFGRPWTFCGQVEQTRWVTFTVTESQGNTGPPQASLTPAGGRPGSSRPSGRSDLRFSRWMETFSGSPAGRGGLVTLKSSSWLLTFHLYPSPAFPGQPEGTGVWWGYGLLPDRVGDHVRKKMTDCSGQEILIELFSHLGLQAHMPELLAASNCIPCLLPYATSQFMPRARGDRPEVIPPGTADLAIVGQYCEIPGNVVYTVEYSVHSARLAVASLLGRAQEVPAAYEGLDHPNALVEALRRILQ